MAITSQQPSLRQIDFGYYVSHYAGLLWRYKWYIAVSGPLAVAAALFLLSRFAFDRPELVATVLIGQERQAGGAIEIVASDDDQAELMRSRNFLQEVVQRMSLCLVVSEYQRREIFDSVYVDSTAAMGTYVLTIDTDERDRFILSFTNEYMGMKNRPVKSGKLSALSSISDAGMYLAFNKGYLKNPWNVTFHIVSMRSGVETIRSKLLIHGIDRRRGRNHIVVQLAGRDYGLITETVNAIADYFIEKNLSFKKRKTQKALEVLKKQLETANEELAKSEGNLRVFRTANPTIGLTDVARQAVGELAQIETADIDVSGGMREAGDLFQKYKAAGAEDRPQLIAEMLVFLDQRNSTSAPVLKRELDILIGQRETLRQTLFPNHPQLQDNEDKIHGLGLKVLTALREYMEESLKRSSDRKEKVSQISQKLRGLPSQELRLANLERRQRISSDIYSMVLSRYNQAKVADAVEVADVYIMDYAIPPSAPRTNVLMLLGLALGIGLAVAIGPPILLDLVDKTARTEFELRRMTPILVLESIPDMSSVGRRTSPAVSDEQAPAPRSADPLLIAGTEVPEHVKEIYRSLRAKIAAGLRECERKNLIVTSLDIEAGKSTVSPNIAIAMAQQGFRTLIIDGDLRRGVLHNSFCVRKSPGLSEVLSGGADRKESDVLGVVQETDIERLDFLSSGRNVDEAAELLVSPLFADIVDCVSLEYDFVVFDSPPFGVTADAVSVHESFSKYLLVVRAGVTNVADLNRKLDEYPDMKRKTMGVILNRAIVDRRMRYYRDTSYYRYVQARDDKGSPGAT